MRRLSKHLLEKSQEAFLLSLEVYNKPTIKYRIESFCFFFCNAWELLLKSYILEGTKKEKSIFYPKERNNPRKSISLRDAIKRVFPNEKDPIRKNIEDIAELRDCATHLIIKELDSVYVGLFQAGVLNYIEMLKSWFGISIADKISPAMLSLIFDIGKIDPVILQKKQGKEITDFFLQRQKQIQDNTLSISDKRYSISIEYKLALVKNPKNADITLSVGPQAKLSGMILEVARDPSLTHPYRQIDCINQIKKTISSGITFNQYDFQAIIHKEKIRGNDKYHYCYKTFGANTYSQDLVDSIMKKIQTNPNYLSETRTWFKHGRSKKGR